MMDDGADRAYAACLSELTGRLDGRKGKCLDISIAKSELRLQCQLEEVLECALRSVFVYRRS